MNISEPLATAMLDGHHSAYVDSGAVTPCTCDVRAPRHVFAHGREMIGKYAVRLDQWEDDTVFDPACPFHGDNGTMVVPIRPTRSLDA